MTCSKCKKNEPKEGQRYCRSCINEYDRSYRRTVVLQSVRKAKREGAQGFKDRALGEFQRIGVAELNGLTAAAIIEDLEV